MMKLIPLLIVAAMGLAQTKDSNPRGLASVTFANLGTPADGTVVYCTTCAATSPATSGGTGAVARRENGAWNAGGGTANTLHSITFFIDGGGSAIATGDRKVFPGANYSCTINKAEISSDVSGSITVDIWKKAGAIPTSADKISASAPVTLSSAQLNQNSALTGWTTAVSTGDVFGFSVATASTVTQVTIQIWCQ